MKYSGDRGVLFIDDVAALAAVLGVQETFFLTDPRALTDTTGAVTAPWPVTLAVARLLARVRADTVLPVLAEQDRRARQRAVYGEYYRGRGKNPGTYISAETCAEVDRTYSQGRDLLRQWCGAEAVEARAELEALRLEVVRIGKLTEEAIRLLRDGGQGKAAERLEQQLGVPLELLRRAPAQTD